MPYFLKGNCVWKGTEKDPVEEVKCHASSAEAKAHIAALYSNVEDADEKAAWDAEIAKGGEDATLKGGAGSGWHNPPEGTHTAENAPNFAGGPGADRKYGAEDEPEEGQKHCKCTKCDSIFTLPKGKQCKDVECPGCGGRATQTSPRRDKPAEGEEGGGQSGKKAVEEECPACEENKQETHGCTCPECGKSVQVPLGQKCSEVRCPSCKAMMKQGESGEEKAMTPGPTVHGEGGSMGEVSSVMDDGSSSDGCTCPKCGKGIPCTAKACPYCKESIDRVERGDTDTKSAFTSYKSADGSWRWLTLSSWAVVDKEYEVVSEQAYKDAIAYARETGDWGQLDLVHVNGTDVGDCDTLFIVKGQEEPAKLGAGGTWYDTAKATRAREVIQAEPGDWGVSIKFRYNPQRLVRGVYTGDIQVLKHSILPQAMAASYGTGIAVQGGKDVDKALDDKAAEALQKLGHTEAEVAELAEKQKVAPEEENVAEKEDATEATPERVAVWKQLGEWLFRSTQKEAAPVASTPEEAEKTEEVTPAETVEPAEKAGGEEQPDFGALAQAMGEVISKSLGEMVKAELDERDKRITDLQERISEINTSVEERVEKRLSDLPQVVTVAASQVAATVVDEPVQGLTFGQAPPKMEEFSKALLADIAQVVKEKTKGAKFQV